MSRFIIITNVFDMNLNLISVNKKKKKMNGFVFSIQKMYNSVLFNHNLDFLLSPVSKDTFKYEAPVSIFLCLLRELSKEL